MISLNRKIEETIEIINTLVYNDEIGGKDPNLEDILLSLRRSSKWCSFGFANSKKQSLGIINVVTFGNNFEWQLGKTLTKQSKHTVDCLIKIFSK